MKKDTYNDQTIADYLLGSLSEDAAERFDEMSFTDDEFAVRLQAIENDLVDAYVRGELSGSVLDRFNSYYLSSPKRLAKVAFARGLLTVADRKAIDGEANAKGHISSEPFLIARPTRMEDSRRRFFSSPLRALQRGMAAAILLMFVAGGWLIFENLRLRGQVSQVRSEREALENREQQLNDELARRRSTYSERERALEELRDKIASLEQQQTQSPGSAAQPSQQEPVILAFALSPQMRGSGQIATITVPADTDYIALELQLEPNDFASYRAELKSQSGSQVLWKSGRLRARAKGDNKSLTATLRSDLLRSQIYVMEISGVSPTGATEIIGSYPFRIVK